MVCNHVCHVFHDPSFITLWWISMYNNKTIAWLWSPDLVCGNQARTLDSHSNHTWWIPRKDSWYLQYFHSQMSRAAQISLTVIGKGRWWSFDEDYYQKYDEPRHGRKEMVLHFQRWKEATVTICRCWSKLGMILFQYNTVLKSHSLICSMTEYRVRSFLLIAGRKYKDLSLPLAADGIYPQSYSNCIDCQARKLEAFHFPTKVNHKQERKW